MSRCSNSGTLRCRRSGGIRGVYRELMEELADESAQKIEEKVSRWANALWVLRFYDRPPARAYLQAKMLYRDGFYEATIMSRRSIAEMICYDRLDGVSHPSAPCSRSSASASVNLIKC